MIIRLAVEVECQTCGRIVAEPFEAERRWVDEDVIDELLKGEGWQIDGDRHWCRECVEAGP